MCYNKVMRFVEISEAEFEKTKFNCDNFLQSVEMYRRHKKLGREVYLVGVKSDGEIGKKNTILATGMLTALPWHFGKLIYMVPGGWLMDYDGEGWQEVLQFLTKEGKQFCKKHRGALLYISPNIVSQPRDIDNKVIDGPDHLAVKRELLDEGWKYLAEFTQTKWQYVLDLVQDGKRVKAEDLKQNFRNGHKWAIKRALRDGVRVRDIEIDEIDILRNIEHEAAIRHGFREPEEEYFRTMKAEFGDKVQFVVAEMPKKLIEPGAKGYIPVAASMFINDGHETVYLYSGSVRKYQKYGGAHLIQWEMIQRAIKSGCEIYNFYGAKPEKGNGVYAFKQGFRGHVQELLGTFVLPVGGLLPWLYVKFEKPKEYGATVEK